MIIIIIIIIYSLGVFHISVSWWSITEVWVTASIIIIIIIIIPCGFSTPAIADGLLLETEWQQVLLKYPGLLSVLCLTYYYSLRVFHTSVSNSLLLEYE